jgi:hypothetical protein
VEKNNNNNNNDDIKNSQNSQNGDADNKNQTTETKTSLWTSVINENEADQIEHNDANTFLRLNCKLFLLDTDKAKWLERGYGILKLIDSNDGLNCKISKPAVLLLSFLLLSLITFFYSDVD